MRFSAEAWATLKAAKAELAEERRDVAARTKALAKGEVGLRHDAIIFAESQRRGQGIHPSRQQEAAMPVALPPGSLYTR
jgi:hypothetical protein